jgi:glyoxylase-like metal-dependent hydrolase (beta-lactamase superfamily II)
MTQNQPNALSFPFADVPAPAQATEVSPGILWIRMPLPFALNHINLWLLRDGDGWTLVDCGFGIDATLALWEQIFATLLNGKKIQRIIVTHYHPDHVGCAGWLQQRWNCEVWMTETEYLSAHAAVADGGGDSINRATELFRRHGLTGERLESNAVRKNNYKKGVPSLPHSFRRILEGDEISIDGKSWRVIVGRGHAPEHAILYCADNNVMISGDQVLPKISTNVGVWPSQPNGDPLKLFLDSMDKFSDLPADVLILPSHGPVFRGLHERLGQLKQHHDDRLAEVVEACAEPKTAAELLPVLFRRELDAHQVVFAMGEAIAHLNYLMYSNRLKRSLDHDEIYRFVRN